jgi:hypothetical protein
VSSTNSGWANLGRNGQVDPCGGTLAPSSTHLAAWCLVLGALTHYLVGSDLSSLVVTCCPPAAPARQRGVSGHHRHMSCRGVGQKPIHRTDIPRRRTHQSRLLGRRLPFPQHKLDPWCRALASRLPKCGTEIAIAILREVFSNSVFILNRTLL